ncbi:LysR family transcriptional regulator [Marinomonas pollencensis]|uniref:LysR family transcriptional regulator n=1 Tax=Marinomonas pollencensis TaxID=491954 RepID=A0A3E0DFI8_9GAMM|nr:LysR family transcriptional regulator [Marinomonas pollencensis]REG81452.1 LysR family transcriptional regulator [Marinomonas pollencensis]
MELKWLEDYLALAKNGSFSKAAEARFVTQPAFSRRIRSLESWLGVSLVDRSQYPTTFTKAGMAFLEQAESLVKQMYGVRNHLTSLVNDTAEMVVMSQHSLAVSFMPDWLQQIEPFIGDSLIRVNTDNLHDSIDSFLSGAGDFLVCFSTPEVAKQLSRSDIETIQITTDRIVPVTAVKADGQPVYRVSQESLRWLTYPKESFLGSLLSSESLSDLSTELKLNKVCENALAEGLKALVEKGYGVAWIPESLVKKELDAGQVMVLGAPLKSIELDINIYRFKGKHSDFSTRFWQYLSALYQEAG